jgi:hypothetical protein
MRAAALRSGSPRLRTSAAGAALLGCACVTSPPPPLETQSSTPADNEPQASAATLEYHLTYDPSELGARWRIDLVGSGLAAHAGELELRLDDWGEWTEVDAYHLPFLECDPPARRAEDARDRFVLEAPAQWDGRLRASYAIAPTELGSKAQEAHGLLPFRAPTYCLGFSSNTLIELEVEGAAIEAERTIAIDVPPEWTIATGFGGISKGHQTASVPAGLRNTAISFGRPVALSAAGASEPPLEIVQWGGTDDVTGPLERFARTYVAACTQSLGVPPTGAVRLLVTEPGFGGTRVDGAFVIGCPNLLEDDPYTLHFLAHEIFHDWLGGRLRAQGSGESLAWFWEGFTEYLSLWHLAHAELVPRSWFVERLFDYDRELGDVAAWKEVAFADPEVAWRDPEIEQVAYKGSALLAFSLDVALRRAGRPGLVELIRDLLAEPDGAYSLDVLQAWLELHDQGELWRRSFAGTARPDLRSDLEFIGFAARLPVELTYVGLEVSSGGDVTAVDPEGPAAAAGMRVGDRIFGRAPTPAVKPEIGPEVTTAYRWGLDGFEPGAAGAFLDVLRGGEELRVDIAPRLVAGGYRAGLAAEDPRTAAFFR